MNKDNLFEFESEFNKTKHSIGDFFKVAKSIGISIDELGEPTENETEFIWTISPFGTLHQCKDCKRLEFVETGSISNKNCDI